MPGVGGSGQIAYFGWEVDGKILVNTGVAGAPQQTLLTFPGDVSTNPDLKYFEAGDAVSTFIYPFQESDLSNSAGDAVTNPIKRL